LKSIDINTNLTAGASEHSAGGVGAVTVASQRPQNGTPPHARQDGICSEHAAVNRRMGGALKNLVGIQRDIRNLEATAATLGMANNDHTQQPDGISARHDLIERRTRLHADATADERRSVVRKSRDAVFSEYMIVMGA